MGDLDNRGNEDGDDSVFAISESIKMMLMDTDEKKKDPYQ